VLFRITGSTGWMTSIAGTSGSNYTATGLQPATSYDFAVVGVNGGGSGPASATVSAITQAAQLSTPPQVSGVGAAALSYSSIQVSWTSQTGTNAATSYTVQYRPSGTTAWTGAIAGITGTTQIVAGLLSATSYDFSVLGANASGSGPVSAVVSASTQAAGTAVSSITWALGPAGPYIHGTGTIGVNAHVTPASAAIQFGFSTSSTVPPVSWTTALLVNTNFWAAYVPTPSAAGTWYAWAEGTDGSSPTIYPTTFVVQ
jgi:cellulose 1,4-beta-cellobiosidase